MRVAHLGRFRPLEVDLDVADVDRTPARGQQSRRLVHRPLDEAGRSFPRVGVFVRLVVVREHRRSDRRRRASPRGARIDAPGPVEPDPRGRHEVRREPDEPGVRRIVRRPRLARYRYGEGNRIARPHRQRPGTLVHRVAQHGLGDPGDIRLQHPLALDPALPEHAAVPALHAEDRPGRDADAEVREGAVGAGNLDRTNVHGADRGRRHPRHTR